MTFIFVKFLGNLNITFNGSDSSDGDTCFCTTPEGSGNEPGEEPPMFSVASQELADELAALLCNGS